MKPRRMKQEQAKRWPSVEENSSVPASDKDKPQVTIDIEKAREEFRRLAEVKDEPTTGRGWSGAREGQLSRV